MVGSTPVCVDLSRFACNLVHMAASSLPTSLHSDRPHELAPGTLLRGLPVVAGVAYAPVICPGRHPLLDGIDELPDIDEADRAAEAARFGAAASAVAERLRERAAHATGAASEVLAATAALA